MNHFQTERVERAGTLPAPCMYVSDAVLASWQMHIDHARALSMLAAEAPRAAGRRLRLSA